MVKNFIIQALVCYSDVVEEMELQLVAIRLIILNNGSRSCQASRAGDWDLQGSHFERDAECKCRATPGS
jgi:hypothetical protein